MTKHILTPKLIERVITIAHNSCCARLIAVCPGLPNVVVKGWKDDMDRKLNEPL